MYGAEMMGLRRTEKEKSEDVTVDLEAGESSLLYPGISRGENELRWGFVRKVYGILCAQLLLTTVVSAAVVFYPGLNSFLLNSPAALGVIILPLICTVCLPSIWDFGSNSALDLIIFRIYIW